MPTELRCYEDYHNSHFTLYGLLYSYGTIQGALVRYTVTYFCFVSAEY